MGVLINVARRARRFVNERRGLDIITPITARVPRLRLGSVYGGWVVSPPHLPDRPVVFSVGLGTDITFDLAMIERFGATVYGFDPTPKAVEYMRAATLPPTYHFEPVGLGATDGELTFQLGRPDFESYSTLIQYARPADVVCCRVERLTTLMQRVGATRLDVLKIDIEGGEYSSVPDVLASGVPIAQLLVELHYDHSAAQMKLASDLVAAIEAAGFRLFDRTPVGKELSFIHAGQLGRRGAARA